MEKISEGMRQYNFISSEISAVYHKLNVKLGISDTVSYILYSLYERPGASQNEIVRMTGLSKQTINSAVKKMTAEGFFEPLKGFRNEPLSLTQKGNSFMEDKISVVVHIENSIFRQWDEEKQRMFKKLNEEYLEKLRQGVEELS